MEFVSAPEATTAVSWLYVIPWSAITALVGTLAGAWLGHRLSVKQQREQIAAQQKYDDRTRFHAERLETYTSLLRNHSLLISSAKVFYAESAADGASYWESANERMTGFVNAYVHTKLLASADVLQTIQELYEVTGDFVEGGPGENNTRYKKALAVSLVVEASMRKELGISGFAGTE